VQEQIDQASVEPVDAARVSSWLAATGEATVTGQHAARASPSDATSSMQQHAPQVEDDDISMKKAENKQLFTVIYYLGSIDSMI
jgi:hypothetical protein